MIHNIVTDKNGDEHQAVMDNGEMCSGCSLNEIGLDDECVKALCTAMGRKDNTPAIYKRRIKIGDVKNGN